MNPQMPFSTWRETCGELAMLRVKTGDSAPTHLAQCLFEPQRLLEEGDVRGARAHLAIAVEELAETPEVVGALTSMYWVLRRYDGVSQAP